MTIVVCPGPVDESPITLDSALQQSLKAKAARRFRSYSVSADLECSGHYQSFSNQLAYFPRRPEVERNRTVSACIVSSSVSSVQAENRHLRLFAPSPSQFVTAPGLCDLPALCMERVFTYLTPQQRGQCAKVCKEWHNLVKSPQVWQDVDFTVFAVCQQRNVASHDCSEDCYPLYVERVKKYMRFLCQVKPYVKRLKFAFDIDCVEDGWLQELMTLMQVCRLQELTEVDVNWKETPGKPFDGLSHTVSSAHHTELLHRDRHRQRVFVRFFEWFTAAAPNVTHLSMPFDWTDKSVQYLARLKSLSHLSLGMYTVWQSLPQATLDLLCKCCPDLTHLQIEAWTPSGRGLQCYSLAHPYLRYLDISQCHGFYLSQVSLPALQVFKVARHPWSGPLTSSDNCQLPCLFMVFGQGAPSLQRINDHVLQTSWADGPCDQLENVLLSACSCRLHSRL